MAHLASYTRMLESLEYPLELDVKDDQSIAMMISWLEDRKIRIWEIEERIPLRTAGPQWIEAFERYLNDLDCPHQDMERRVGFVLQQAVACAYEDGEDAFKADAEAWLMSQQQARIQEAEINQLATLLDLHNLSTDDALLRICAAAAHVADAKDNTTARTRHSFFQENPQLSLGFTTNNQDTDNIAKILRLFYLADLRNLQNNINAILVRAQHFVANPRTNTSLGKVGR
uniref:Uncharacterized protein n=1 Tax=Aureoumbra lagunensis TaxID=44058 RepID=A0A7S3K0K5_9STRA|mmetsp:Transcript_6010/g.8501  ORF Transcript_6010/g.8501 Transcript_6010/m.8501 type:complete len:229 (+) Transcript_6010:8-694(+)